MPSDWINLTTHRLDIYNEEHAKSEFLNQFENLYRQNIYDSIALKALPTAYDYIRLGHPLSSVLEWMVAQEMELPPEQVISFDSQTMPLLAVLRTNLLAGKNTRIIYKNALPAQLDVKLLEEVYHYNFELVEASAVDETIAFNGSTVYVEQWDDEMTLSLRQAQRDARKRNTDFHIYTYQHLGSIILIDTASKNYVGDIQHVRRRETVAMTPSNSKALLEAMVNSTSIMPQDIDLPLHKNSIATLINTITNTTAQPLFASSGLSMQYAIMMGLVDDAQRQFPDKKIKFVVPPNCYGGTNDQARRVAAANDHIDIVDLPVDGDNDMVQSTHLVLDQIAKEDAIPYIIAEIPTNPRVEVPDLIALKEALSLERKTPSGSTAVAPVFILDQTFCPNVHFLGTNDMLSTVKAIAYASGSKFPSGGKCTAGYAVMNDKAASLVAVVEKHLLLCGNEATAHQYEILAQQLPSMNRRIADAYVNTREFVNFIEEVLPNAKINFVSEELASHGFTPSVFSLDLPTQGDTAQEREDYKREQNLKLINMMITQIPDESKYCVSYGQLKGCYWTIPATSTQGTTKESDKDYIARVSVSPDLDLDKHKRVFEEFVDGM